jgi:hypothetical protein
MSHIGRFDSVCRALSVVPGRAAFRVRADRSQLSGSSARSDAMRFFDGSLLIERFLPDGSRRLRSAVLDTRLCDSCQQRFESG